MTFIYPRRKLRILVIASWLTLAMAFVETGSNAFALNKVVGDTVATGDLQTVDGKTVSLKSAVADQFTLLVFSRTSTLISEHDNGYFRQLVPQLSFLNYQIVLVTDELNETTQTIANSVSRNARILIDPKQKIFAEMGLGDGSGQTPEAHALYLVSPKGKILFQYSSVSDAIPLSGEVLILAARVYRDSYESEEIRPGFLFPSPDDSVIDLLKQHDIANSNSYFISAYVGGTAYEARQGLFMPRWSPGLEAGRRFGRTGVFLRAAYDESFDFTQEVKKLEVYDLGVGIDHVFLYGRIRSSAALGIAILGTQTDFDERGTIGWFAEVRPLSYRIPVFKTRVLELTPLSINLSIPVARGIPLILFSYFTTASLEFSLGRNL